MRFPSTVTPVIAALLLFLVPAYGGATVLQVVTTTTVFADLVKNVGGDRVTVSSIVPFGADPHTFEPTPREARALATADVLFLNGFGLEEWLADFLRNTASPRLQQVILADGLKPIKGAVFAAVHHDHDAGDPHFWLNPRYAAHYVRRIESALSAADPKGAEYYTSRAATYIERLEQLDRWIEEQIATIPEENRIMLTYHDAFAYYADRYGLTLQGVLVRNPDREPSSRELARLVQEVRALGTKAIFAEPQINPKYAQTLANETGIRVAYLYSDALTAEVPTYIDMMRFNTESIVEALR